MAVIGAGTMGAAIAALAANAGLEALLLDMAPTELTPEERARGLTLDDDAVRYRVVREGFERIRAIHPPSFTSEEAVGRVRLGNLEDDFERLRDVDWIVEAVVENLAVKRGLMARLDAVRRPGTIVTTNTSGLPVAAITEGRSEGFRRRFFGTHFFNPPRYMKLLELIPGDADPDAVTTIVELAEHRLDKEVVYCKDTPNFIANRILSVHSSFVIAHALAEGYGVEEVDAVTGPLIGRPKTATFRVQNLVGIDVAAAVAGNLHRLIPHDPERHVLRSPRAMAAIEGLIERGRLGNKSGQGFYRRHDEAGETRFDVVDLETFDYRPARLPRFPAVAAVAGIDDLGERLRALFADEHRHDRGARLAWASVAHLLSYAAAVAPEIAHDLASVDRALRLGFGYEAGPFELWDRLGVATTAARMEADGYPVASWVKRMLDDGRPSFYHRREGHVTGCYEWRRRDGGGSAAASRDARV